LFVSEYFCELKVLTISIRINVQSLFHRGVRGQLRNEEGQNDR
jgi:hypothetical protein